MEQEGHLSDGHQAPLDAFVTLVDEYIDTYPLTARGSLSQNSLRIVAAKILLYKRSMMKPPEERSQSWAGEGMVRFAAIMLVLFVQECLAHNRKSILGLVAQDWYELLSNVVRQSGMTREELMVELIDVDLEGSATQLASSAVLSKLWTDATDEPEVEKDVLQDVTEASCEEWESEDAMLPETAKRNKALAASDHGPDRAGLPAAPLFRAKLFRRSHRLRMACAAGAIIWFLAFQFATIERLYGKDVAQVALFTMSLGFSSIMTAAYFPTDLAAHRSFTLLPAGLTSLVVWAGVTVSFFVKTKSHVNLPCKLVHAAICLTTAAAWSSAFVLSLLGRYTWSACRVQYTVDGAAFLVGVLALRALGPPPAYPPGNVSLVVALLRGAFSVTVALTFTPELRTRLAALANSTGMHDVTVQLGDIKQPTDFKAECLAAAGPSIAEGSKEDGSGSAEGPSKDSGSSQPTAANSRPSFKEEELADRGDGDENVEQMLSGHDTGEAAGAQRRAPHAAGSSMD